MEYSWDNTLNANYHLNYPNLDAGGTISSNGENITEYGTVSYDALDQLSGTQARSDRVPLETDGHSGGLSQNSLNQDPHSITFNAVVSWNGSEEDVFGTVDDHTQTLRPQSQGVHLSHATFRQWGETRSQMQEEGSLHNNPAGPFDDILPMPSSSPTPTQDALPDTSTSILAATPSRSSTSTEREHHVDRTMIGSMYSTNKPDIFVFECASPRCCNRTFGRWYDFKRHYNGAHAETRTEFWCREPECNRSMAAGGRPFPRKDRMREHVRKVHGG